YFELVKNDRYLAYAYNSLGLVESDLGQYEDAIKYHQLSLSYRRKLNDKLSEVYALNNIGEVYVSQKMYVKALDYFNQALSYDNFFEKNPIFYSNVLGNLAQASFKLGNTDHLPKMYEEALKISDSLNDIPVIIKNKMHLSEY